MVQNQTNIVFVDNNKNCRKCDDQEKKQLGSGGNGSVSDCSENFVIKESFDKELTGEYNYIKDNTLFEEKKWNHVAKMYAVFDGYSVNNKTIILEKLTPLPEFLKKSETSETYNANVRYKVIKKLVSLVTGLHNDNKYSHNDLKPDNIGVKDNGNDFELKLLDMGSSEKFKNECAEFHTEGYTVPYASPLIFEEIHSNTERDLWALGCTIYELVAKQRLFQHPNESINPLCLLMILLNFGKNELNYMLGGDNGSNSFTKNNKSHPMETSRNAFVTKLTEFKNVEKVNKIKELIFNNMKMSFDKIPQNVQNEQQGGSHNNTGSINCSTIDEFNNEYQKLISTNIIKYVNNEVIIKDINNWKVFMNKFVSCIKINSVKQPQVGGKQTKPHTVVINGKMYERKKITEKQYQKAKSSQKKSSTSFVKRCPISSDGYKYYKYTQSNI